MRGEARFEFLPPTRQHRGQLSWNHHYDHTAHDDLILCNFEYDADHEKNWLRLSLKWHDMGFNL